jgi:hypothetical protein
MDQFSGEATVSNAKPGQYSRGNYIKEPNEVEEAKYMGHELRFSLFRILAKTRAQSDSDGFRLLCIVRREEDAVSLSYLDRVVVRVVASPNTGTIRKFG